jgi:hypothetical protein
MLQVLDVTKHAEININIYITLRKEWTLVVSFIFDITAMSVTDTMQPVGERCAATYSALTDKIEHNSLFQVYGWNCMTRLEELEIFPILVKCNSIKNIK